MISRPNNNSALTSKSQFQRLTNIIQYIQAVRKHSSRTFFKNLWSFEITLKKKNPSTSKLALQKHRRNLRDRLQKLTRLCQRTSGYLSNLTPKSSPNQILKSQPLYLVALDIDLDPDVFQFQATSPPFTKSPETYQRDWQNTIVKLSKKHIAKSLIINECRIDTRIVGCLVRNLGKTLQELWLGNNVVGDDGAELIAKNVRRLVLLSLEQNPIGDYGYTAIISNLTQLKRLEIGRTSNRHSQTFQSSLKELASSECSIKL